MLPAVSCRLIGVENLNSRCIRCGGAAACRNVSFSEFVYTSSGVKSRPDDTAITIMDISCRPEYCIYSTVVFKRQITDGRTDGRTQHALMQSHGRAVHSAVINLGSRRAVYGLDPRGLRSTASWRRAMLLKPLAKKGRECRMSAVKVGPCVGCQKPTCPNFMCRTLK